jgi:hypothetical protein
MYSSDWMAPSKFTCTCDSDRDARLRQLNANSPRTFIRGSGLLPTDCLAPYRTVGTQAHIKITLALGGLIGRHPRPRELEEIEGLDAPRPIALECCQTNPAPLAGRADLEGSLRTCFIILYICGSWQKLITC